MFKLLRGTRGKGIKGKVHEQIRELTGPCPICGQSLVGHSYHDLASAPDGSPADKQLKELIGQRTWSEAATFQFANAVSDIRVWSAVRCGDRVTVVPVVLTFEIWSKDRREDPIVLAPAESWTLLEHVGDRWQAL